MPRNLKQEPHFVTTSNPAIKTVNDVNYDKRHFVPFADERDHLGRILIRDSLIVSDEIPKV